MGTVYKTSDGWVFESESKAREHQDELDGKAFYRKQTYQDGKFYEGFMKCYGGLWYPSGRGKMKWPDGRVYEGDWVYNGDSYRPHGEGKMTLANGEVYEGEWKDGKFVGDHIDNFFANANAIIEQAMKNKNETSSAPQQQATSSDFGIGGSSAPTKGKIKIDGEEYEGELINGIPNGKGKIYRTYGGIYEGDFVDGKPHGKGKYTTDDFVYEGDFEKGDIKGKGKKTYTDGGVYVGDFRNGRRSGNGKMTYPNGKVEEGNWRKDCFEG